MLVVALLQATTAAAVVSHAVPSGAVATSIELGGGRAMTVYTPFQDRDAEADAVAAILGVSKEVVSGAREALDPFDNAIGQKVWPSSIALARELCKPASTVNVKGLHVVELGCGLGTVGIAAALAGASSVLLTDFQQKSLDWALAAAEANGVGDVVSTCLLDWTHPEPLSVVSDATGGSGAYDLVLGSDILYEKEQAGTLCDVISALLLHADATRREEQPPSRPEPRAVLVDPPLRKNRQRLPLLCSERGLYWGGEMPLADAEEGGTVLINLLKG